MDPQSATVILTYRHENREHRISKNVDVQTKLDTGRLRRRVGSRLDLLMGKPPQRLL